MIGLYLNDFKIFEHQGDEKQGMELPRTVLTICVPQVFLRKNDTFFGNEEYSVGFAADTMCCYTVTMDYDYWSFVFKILGVGFAISYQTGY